MKRQALPVLTVGQTWEAAPRDEVRRITKIWTSGASDAYAMGTQLLSWTWAGGEFGLCTSRTFRQWIARTGAALKPDVPDKLSFFARWERVIKSVFR